MYKLWDILKPLENFIDFKVLEQKILTLQEMVNQGLANDKVIDAMKNNDICISAVFNSKEKMHKLFIKGIKIDNVKKDLLTGLSDIDVKDVMIDNVSFIENKDKLLGIIL
jgi:hypothetical protein